MASCKSLTAGDAAHAFIATVTLRDDAKANERHAVYLMRRLRLANMTQAWSRPGRRAATPASRTSALYSSKAPAAAVKMPP